MVVGLADKSLLRLEELYLLNLGSLQEELVTLNLSAFRTEALQEAALI